MESVITVFISIPREEAKPMAKGLVENRLAACVNILPRIESYYWWDDKVEYDEEALLFIKTSPARLMAMTEYVVEHHPYPLPEIVALEPTDGLPEYFAWVNRETKGE